MGIVSCSKASIHCKCISGSRPVRSNLLQQCLDRVIRAPSRWFDITPVGRVLNRLVSDIGVADDSLQSSIRGFGDSFIAFLSAFGIIVYLVPVFLPLALIVMLLYYGIAGPYVRCTRDLRRLENKLWVAHLTQDILFTDGVTCKPLSTLLDHGRSFGRFDYRSCS